MLKNKKTRQKISTNAVEYAKNIELNGKNENWNRATKAVKKIAVQHVRKVKDKKKHQNENTNKQYKNVVLPKKTIIM